jgi:hypothetical protein
MSRRASRIKNVTIDPQALADATWHWEDTVVEEPEVEPRKPFVDDWQATWAATTWSVVEVVHGDAGWRMYRNDPVRRDDLFDWLLVQAQEIAAKYVPRWKADDPERVWAGTLYAQLQKQSRWHFASTIGARNEDNVRVAREMTSIDALLDRANDHTVASRVHHYDPVATWRSIGPESWVQIEEAAEKRLHEPTPVEVTSSCAECDRPVFSRRLCRYHYDRQRELWGTGKTCQVEGCPNPSRARGRCSKHYQAAQKAGEFETRTPQNGGQCTECAAPAVVKGMCRRCYAREYARARKKKGGGS